MTDSTIDSLVQTIVKGSGSAVELEDAYMALLDSGEAAINALSTAIDDTSHDQHHTLASVLCDILVDVGDNDALELLCSLMKHPNNAVFTPSAHAIARLKVDNINDVLCEMLKHPAPQVRRVAAWQLGRNRATQANACLLHHLDDVDMETLRGIIWSLGHIGDNRTVQRLLPFTQHVSGDIAFMAKEAIQRITDDSVNLPFK